MTESNKLADTGYRFEASLVQAIAAQLNTQPAGVVRGLLNALEHECVKQDQTRADQAAAAVRAEVRAELNPAVGPAPVP